MLLRGLFWGSFAALAWTHAGYPLAVAALARLVGRGVEKRDIHPSVSVIVAAHDEEDVIRRRLENLLALEYPPELLEIVVASDGSTDATDAIVAEVASREPRVRLLPLPRGGKLAALTRAVADTTGEVVAFSDANTQWARDALAKLVRNFADPEVGYVCGRVRLLPADGSNREGAYWRYELWTRQSESAIGSITAGNGAIYAVRRADWVEQPFGQDSVLPVLMAQRRRRAVYEPEALAFEKPARDLEDEYARKVRMIRWSWRHALEGRPLAGVPPLFALEFISHRLLRYGSGLLHLALAGASAALARSGRVYAVALAAQLAFAAAAAAGRLRAPVPGAALAYYYVLVTRATVVALARYLAAGTPPAWEKTEGSR